MMHADGRYPPAEREFDRSPRHHHMRLWRRMLVRIQSDTAHTATLVLRAELDAVKAG